MKGGTAGMASTRSNRRNWYSKDWDAYNQKLSDRPDQSHRALRAKLAVVLREEVTPRQREMIALYYGEELTMREIAARLGVDPSTVSRTLKRGEERVRRCLRYSRDDLLDQGSRERPRTHH